MRKICTQCSDEGKWLPTPIANFDHYLSKFICSTPNFTHVTELRKNIAYNLQFLQFQKQILTEFNVTQVILTQTWKLFIVVGVGIVEAILYYLLISKGLHKTLSWKEVGTFKANEKSIDNDKYKTETILYKKLDIPEFEEMNLHSMINKAEKDKLLGQNEEIYKKLQYLRKLRNKVHIHIIDTNWDTDWTKFNSNEITTMKIVLRSFMLSSLFKPTEEEKVMFDFLKTT